MTKFLVRRAGQSVIVVLGVIVVTFVLIHLLPGTPARDFLGDNATPDAVRIFNKANGLDRPEVEQFVFYVGRLLHGNLGYSYTQSQPVASLIAERLPKDLVLLALSTGVALILAIPLAIYEAVYRNHLGDYIGTGISFTLYSMPGFLVAYLLLAGLSVQLRLFPPEAPQEPTIWGILGHPAGLVLPVLTLALINIATFARYLRSAFIETFAQDYIRVVRAKGTSERGILTRHLFRNSAGSLVTLLGLYVPQFVAGAIVIEEVFNFPGMGLLFFQAATQQDYPILLGFALFVGVATVIGNFLADVGYALLDPRVRLS